MHNLNKGIEDRKNILSNNIVDINYHDFIKSPLDCIKNSYAHLGFDMTIKTENSIQDYISKGTNKSKIAHSYSLDEYGLTEEKVRDQFSDYMLNYDF